MSTEESVEEIIPEHEERHADAPEENGAERMLVEFQTWHSFEEHEA